MAHSRRAALRGLSAVATVVGYTTVITGGGSGSRLPTTVEKTYEKLEAPPGFEPGMEVLQSCGALGDVEQFREFANDSATVTAPECSPMLPNGPQ